MTIDLPRGLDWFMIEKDDYAPTSLSEVDEYEPENWESIAFPVGIIETTMLLTIAAAIFGRKNEELFLFE